jgi:hypothetical protein
LLQGDVTDVADVTYGWMVLALLVFVEVLVVLVAQACTAGWRMK